LIITLMKGVVGRLHVDVSTTTPGTQRFTYALGDSESYVLGDVRAFSVTFVRSR